MQFHKRRHVVARVAFGFFSILAVALACAGDHGATPVPSPQVDTASFPELKLEPGLLEQEGSVSDQDQGSALPQTAPNARSDSLDSKIDPETEALQRVYRSADSGDPAAMTRLGALFQQGIGVPQSYPEALKWYLRAAELGEVEAMSNIGTLYLIGQGVSGDHAEAMKWYQRAIEGGSLTAMVNVAKMYYFGIGVARSYPDAAKWFQLASARGSAAAMNSLGLMYDAGVGVTQDRGTASTLLRRAAGLGYGPAMANLGSLYEKGMGVENNPVEAYAWMPLSKREFPRKRGMRSSTDWARSAPGSTRSSLRWH
jgi:TPR repeat protein